MASPLLNVGEMTAIRSKVLATLTALCASVFVAHANPFGPNAVRYSVGDAMTSTGVDADAKGHVQALVRQRGDSDLQRLRVRVANLDSLTSYTLLAAVGDDTNLVAVTNFTTSVSGKGVLIYAQKRGSSTLPVNLEALTEIQTLAVANTNGEVILFVNLHESASMKFEMASVFDNTGSDPLAIGCVAVSAQQGVTQFRLLAAGQSSTFTLCVNETPVATYQADFAGHINVGALPLAAPSPVSFRKLSLRNAGDEVVLQSEVQK